MLVKAGSGANLRPRDTELGVKRLVTYFSHCTKNIMITEWESRSKIKSKNEVKAN